MQETSKFNQLMKEKHDINTDPIYKFGWTATIADYSGTAAKTTGTAKTIVFKSSCQTSYILWYHWRWKPDER